MVNKQKESEAVRISYKNNNFINNFIKNNVVTSIILLYYLVTIVVSAILYPILQLLLNYPSNNEEISAKLGTSNIAQYIIIILLSILIGSIIFTKAFKGINNWDKLDSKKEEDLKQLRIIREKCINLPYIIFLGQALIINIPLIPILLLVRTLNDISMLAVIKVLVMVFSLMSLAAVISHTFSRRLFKIILLKTYVGSEMEGIRIGLRNKIFFQILPMLILTILYTALIGYSRLIDEKGDMIYQLYKVQLSDRINGITDLKNAEQAFKILGEFKVGGTEPIYFVKTPEGKIITSGNKNIGGYLTYFISNPYEGDRIFDINAETQGVVNIINSNGTEWRIGVIFKVASEQVLVFFLVGFLALLILNIFVLYYFSKSLSDDISLVVESLTDIANGEYVDIEKKLPVTSNDEIGDLVIAFNKIQEREKAHIKEVEEQQAIIIERERLASLGQLIGGIAHNIRTPIMSISGAIEGLKDLVKEYKDSVGDTSVSVEDHHEIAREMTEWLNKMGPYCSYMSDMLTAVKEQTVYHNATEKLEFTIRELTRRVELLMNNELKRSCCNLKTNYNIDMNSVVSGDISILVQVLNNLITNAIQSYSEPGHDIEFGIQRIGNKVELKVKDYGMGMPEKTKDKLFKEMVTTKGKQGTGLGLFISYSNIKARFQGNMWFESEEGKGTTFYVSIPVQ